MSFYSTKNKIPKSQLPAPSKYIEYYYHQKPKTERKWSNYINVLSIDPGRVNLAVRIERWSIDKTITPLLFVKLDLEEDDAISPYIKALNFLDKNEELLLTVNIMVIEKQLPFNYKCVRISQHLITYFMTLTMNNDLLPSIYEIDSKLKGECLGAPKSLNDKDLKKWAVTKAIEILEARGDKYSLDILNNIGKKKDDLADTVVQVESLFNYIGIGVITAECKAMVKPMLNIQHESKEYKDPLLAEPEKPKIMKKLNLVK
jgi:hypothetical protein